MIDVHLIGYTADLEYLVLDLDGESNGRYRLVVDADLLATLLEMRNRTLEEGERWPGEDLVGWDEDDPWEDELEDEWAADEDVGAEEDEPDEPELDEDQEAEEPEDASGDADADDEPVDDLDDAERSPDRPDDQLRDDRDRPERPDEPAEERAVDGDEEPEPAGAGRSDRSATPVADRARSVASTASRREPKLSPAEIQSLLRSGRSPSSVAKAADTDVAWIERWLPPILEERARVLREARALKLVRPRLGPSRSTLGDAVARSLAQRNVDDEDIRWEASRRNDGRWKVSVKYRHRNRNRTASWTYDPREGEIESASDLAQQLGFHSKRSSKKSQKKRKTRSSKKTKQEQSSKEPSASSSASGQRPSGEGAGVASSNGEASAEQAPTPADAS